MSLVPETEPGGEVRCRESSFWQTEIRTLQQRPRQVSHSRIENQSSYTTSPNADSTISLSTLGTAGFLDVANRTTLECTGLAAW